MHAGLRRDVDGPGRVREAHQRADQSVFGAADGQNRPVVVRVRMDVENACAGIRNRSFELGYQGLVAALGYVRDRDERHLSFTVVEIDGG
jgi:hypothetical protein